MLSIGGIRKRFSFFCSVATQEQRQMAQRLIEAYGPLWEEDVRRMYIEAAERNMIDAVMNMLQEKAERWDAFVPARYGSLRWLQRFEWSLRAITRCEVLLGLRRARSHRWPLVAVAR